MDSIRRRHQKEEVIRLDEEGNWKHGDYPILHERTVTFLHKNINVDDNGRFYLSGEDKPVYFEVDDVPYFVTHVQRTIAGYLITLTDGSMELVDPKSLWVGKKNALYCLVRAGTMGAKFLRASYYEISKDIEPSGKNFVLKFGNKKYAIGVKSLIPKIKPSKKVAKSSDKKLLLVPKKKKIEVVKDNAPKKVSNQSKKPAKSKKVAKKKSVTKSKSKKSLKKK